MTASIATSIRGVVRKSSYILREEGLSTWCDRAWRLALVKSRRVFQNKSSNMRRWSALKNRYEGQRVFLIGNGPSLNDTPLHLLRNEQVMCFNRFYLMFERLAWRPSMFAVSDDRVAFDIADDVVSQVLPVVDWAFFPDIHPYNVDFRKVIPARENVYWLYLDRLDFSDALPYAGMNKTVANVGLQILAYLGFDRIYLVGVDMSYSKPESIVEVNARDWTSTANDDPNHFDPRYFGHGSRYHAPRLDETLEKYQRAREFYSERGVEIVNAGVGGELEVFPRVPIRSLFSEVTPGAELEWIREAVDASDSAVKSGEIDALERGASHFDPGCRGAWVRESVCRAALPGLLQTHLVFGPVASGERLVVARKSGPAWD